MTAAVPRLRMFAGPNGSGKSTIKHLLRAEWLGIYVNADDIEKSLREEGGLDLTDFGLGSSAAEALEYLRQSPRLAGLPCNWQVAGSTLHTNGGVVNSYWAATLVDFIRNELLKKGVSFSFETVMSHASKVTFLKQAQAAGYRTYLYYVATADADINVSRVRLRVTLGGHNVSEDNIRKRYDRSLSLLYAAVMCSHRAYIFDNSGDEPVLLSKVENADTLEIAVDTMPAWFSTALVDPFMQGRSTETGH